MGIRYFAYAFDAASTADALADPRAFIASDPLADAWGMEPHATLSVATFEQRSPKQDMLYLDKAWAELQVLTEPRLPSVAARPAYRMFEGYVTHCEDYSWIPWVRALRPEDMGPIAHDLGELTPGVARDILRRRRIAGESAEYALQYLDAARAFAQGLVRDGRGMVYLIG